MQCKMENVWQKEMEINVFHEGFWKISNEFIGYHLWL
jgi:hypothetical protein